MNINYENGLYCIDNLELLKQIKDKSIDLIYCDILYNTGKKFKDYDDNLGTPEEAMEWYKPRLKEMKRVLKDTGSIYLQMDYRLVHYMKVYMDELFGIKNFRNHIIWSYKSGGASKQNFSRKHDDILFYTKGKKYTFNIQKEKSYMAHKYGFSNIEKFYDEEKKQWYREAIMRDVWDIDIVPNKSKTQKIYYNTQKPKELLERIIKASSNEGDIVADFFCGSGTSLVVAKELGRKYIGCDISSKAITITKERLKNVDK